MRTLVIDTATEACSVALFDDGALQGGDYRHLARGHAEALVPMIAALPGRGKRSGARVIYYWRNEAGRIYLLYAYAKSAQSDLSDAQRKLLVQSVNEVLDDE